MIGLKQVVPTNPHFVDNEETGKYCMVVLDVEPDHPPMQLAEGQAISVINKYEPVDLFHVIHLA